MCKTGLQRSSAVLLDVRLASDAQESQHHPRRGCWSSNACLYGLLHGRVLHPLWVNDTIVEKTLEAGVGGPAVMAWAMVALLSLPRTSDISKPNARPL